MTKLKKVGRIGVLLVAILIVTGAVATFAQDEDPPRPPHGWVDEDAIRAVFAEVLGLTPEAVEAAWDEGKTLTDLCDELGLDLEDTRSEIHERIEALREEAIHQAVADGEITQEFADMLLERTFPHAHGRMAGFHRSEGWPELGRTPAFPGGMGLSIEELRDWHASGMTLEAWAEENGIDLEQLKADIQSRHEEHVQWMLEEGIITEELAEELLDQEMPEGFPGRMMIFPGRGLRHHECE